MRANRRSLDPSTAARAVRALPTRRGKSSVKPSVSAW